MPNLVNLTAEVGAGLIGDDTQPSLTLGNSSTGTSLHINRAATIGAPSVALQSFSVSGASIPVFEFQANALVSAVSIIFAAGTGWAGMSGVRVKFSDGTTYGWIPVIPNAQFTAAAI